MRQVIQSPRTGKLELAEVPSPAIGPGEILVRTHFSVVSPGTEKMAMDFARRSLLGKARSRPDLVSQVVRKLRQEGPLPTYRAVSTRLDAPQPLGYSAAGVVERVGAEVTAFAPGDRVACAGAGYANHAEWNAVPENLAVRVPEEVPLEKAAFATLGAIAMQGLRVGEPALGEIAAVIGLGLIGQLTVQLLRANGCRVLGIDLDPTRIDQARALGAEWTATPGSDHTSWIANAAYGAGADFAMVTAASDDSAPLQLAAELCRPKGRIVAVGATAMDLDRRSFYEKELDLRMSMSYGPGRYDRRYEELGLDYPISHVRWTENRNLAACIALVASGSLDPLRLDVQSVSFDEAGRLYEELAGGGRKGLAVVFRYDGRAPHTPTLRLREAPRPGKDTGSEVGVAFLRAGNYAKGILLPAVARSRAVRRVALITATGPSARRSAEKFEFAACGTDPALALEDPAVDLVFITTRHDSHAVLASAALRAGKAVWLEKPAAVDTEQLKQLGEAMAESGGFLSVGFNRRFSRHTRAIREYFAGRRGPMALHYTVAAGSTPGGTWHTDPKIGGGRMIGEGCHFVDLFTCLVGAPPTRVHASSLGRDPESEDSIVATFTFADGSAATLHYLANASSQLPKERFEVSADGKSALCDNFKTTRFAGGRTLRTANQDKGQSTAVAEVIEAVRQGQPSPIPFEEISAVTRATFAALESLRSGEVVRL